MKKAKEWDSYKKIVVGIARTKRKDITKWKIKVKVLIYVNTTKS